MTIIKATTKKGKNMLRRANNKEGFELRQVYNSYSYAKQTAWNDCYKQCLLEHGLFFRIISHNTFGFSVAWDVENGVRIETPQNSYLIVFPEN